MFFYLVGCKEVGGVETPFSVFEQYVQNNENPFFNHLLVSLPIETIDTDIYARLLENKIGQMISSSNNRADKAILSVFSDKTLSVLKSVIMNKPESYKERISDLTENADLKFFQKEGNLTSEQLFKDTRIGDYMKKHPIFDQIIKILFFQKSEMASKILELRKTVNSLNINRGKKKTSPNQIGVLQLVLKKCKRELNPLDLDSLLGTVTRDDISDPAVVSRKFIKSVRTHLASQEVSVDFDRTKAEVTIKF
jgi:hypothetical protein